ncbi:MAG: prepilin-type N-terminal cleavage/methylation domain-containing protein [Chthoniobacterales bacterium]|nr:prepilin-type N-terminal cleavage/methylation domain-containing protein [Chthoniobacterales bacterium]
MADSPVMRDPGFGRCRQFSVAGFSLTELLVVIAVLAIIAGIGIPAIIGVFSSSNQEVARRNLNVLNGAVLNFNQSNWELVLAAASGSDDEQKIFDSLRYRAATNPTPGSPYLPENAAFVATSGTNTYRARWNGRMFEIVVPGTNGTGLDLMKMMGAVSASPTNTPIPPQP